MYAALYARVSTERQGRDQTIDSQLTALRVWAAANGYEVTEDHVYLDQGVSGSRLDRPGLDRLRDAVRDGAVAAIAVLSPDRLARKYAYQVLLLEEFRRAGCAVVFLHHAISEDPNDQLLLQIQGAIAEYERAGWPSASGAVSSRRRATGTSLAPRRLTATGMSPAATPSPPGWSLTTPRPTWCASSTPGSWRRA